MALSDVLTQFETFVEDKVNAFVGGVETLVADIAPVVEQDFEAFFNELLQIATGAILDNVGKAVSGQEKFGDAVAATVQTVEAQGKTVLVQDAQTAVQTAYRTLQGVLANK